MFKLRVEGVEKSKEIKLAIARDEGGQSLEMKLLELGEDMKYEFRNGKKIELERR